MMRVFEGGVGIVKAGIPERSIDIGVLDSLKVGLNDTSGLSEDIMMVCLEFPLEFQQLSVYRTI